MALSPKTLEIFEKVYGMTPEEAREYAEHQALLPPEERVSNYRTSMPSGANRGRGVLTYDQLLAEHEPDTTRRYQEYIDDGWSDGAAQAQVEMDAVGVYELGQIGATGEGSRVWSDVSTSEVAPAPVTVGGTEDLRATATPTGDRTMAGYTERQKRLFEDVYGMTPDQVKARAELMGAMSQEERKAQFYRPGDDAAYLGYDQLVGSRDPLPIAPGFGDNEFFGEVLAKREQSDERRRELYSGQMQGYIDNGFSEEAAKAQVEMDNVGNAILGQWAQKSDNPMADFSTWVKAQTPLGQIDDWINDQATGQSNQWMRDHGLIDVPGMVGTVIAGYYAPVVMKNVAGNLGFGANLGSGGAALGDLEALSLSSGGALTQAELAGIGSGWGLTTAEMAGIGISAEATMSPGALSEIGSTAYQGVQPPPPVGGPPIDPFQGGPFTPEAIAPGSAEAFATTGEVAAVGAGGAGAAGAAGAGAAGAGGASIVDKVLDSPFTQALIPTVGAAYGDYRAAELAAKSSTDAAKIYADAQREQLEYLKEIDKLPREYRESALKMLGSIYGAGPAAGEPGGPPMDVGGMGSPYTDREAFFAGGPTSPFTDPEGFVGGLKQDPFYGMMLREGEESVLRGASATGGLRSGTASENLAQNSQDVLRQLYGQKYDEYGDYYGQKMGEFQDYTGGLKGMANLPLNTGQIAQTMGDIGRTEAQGVTGAGQAWQRGYENITGDVLSGLDAYRDLSNPWRYQKDQQPQQQRRYI